MPALPFLASLAIVAIGYTLPPLKLSYRTLCELDVAYTHRPAVLVCGWMFMGAPLADLTPWLMAVPIALATLPSITLPNVLDREADARAGKRTIAARFGQRGAIRFALWATAAASVAALVWPLLANMQEAYSVARWGAVPHGIALAWLLVHAGRERDVPRKTMTLMVVSLTFVLWFVVPPLAALVF